MAAFAEETFLFFVFPEDGSDGGSFPEIDWE
jgi:hypothetical protein